MTDSAARRIAREIANTVPGTTYSDNQFLGQLDIRVPWDGALAAREIATGHLPQHAEQRRRLTGLIGHRHVSLTAATPLTDYPLAAAHTALTWHDALTRDGRLTSPSRHTYVGSSFAQAAEDPRTAESDRHVHSDFRAAVSTYIEYGAFAPPYPATFGHTLATSRAGELLATLLTDLAGPLDQLTDPLNACVRACLTHPDLVAVALAETRLDTPQAPRAPRAPRLRTAPTRGR